MKKKVTLTYEVFISKSGEINLPDDLLGIAHSCIRKGVPFDSKGCVISAPVEFTSFEISDVKEPQVTTTVFSTDGVYFIVHGEEVIKEIPVEFNPNGDVDAFNIIVSTLKALNVLNSEDPISYWAVLGQCMEGEFKTSFPKSEVIWLSPVYDLYDGEPQSLDYPTIRKHVEEMRDDYEKRLSIQGARSQGKTFYTEELYKCHLFLDKPVDFEHMAKMIKSV